MDVTIRAILRSEYCRVLDGEAFAGLGRTMYFSLADNEVPAIPKHVLLHLPLLRTFDIGRNRIMRVEADDFKYNPGIQYLVLAGNSLTELDPGSLPPLLKHLHLGRNKLDSLNRTLRDLNQLEWLFLNDNELTTLDGELSTVGRNLKMLHVSNNKLTHLPPEFRLLHRLDALFLHNNRIRSLDGRLQKARHLERLTLYCNELEELSEDDFTEAESLEDLQLGHNSIKSLGRGIGNENGNSALLSLRSLRCLNLTHNELREFSFSDLRGLRKLHLVDLSHNRIAELVKGRTATENLVELEGEEIAGASIQELRLQHNKLSSLEGSLFMGMVSLQRLNLSHNALGPALGPRDLKGLDALRVLDISHNSLTTLEDTSETWLPSLEELNASHNRLVVLSENDFRGLPILCWADMSANRIRSLATDLVANTRCTVHGVPDVLRIYLQDNPVLCDPSLDNLTVALEVNHAKVYGVASDCPTTVATTQSTPTSPLPPLPPTLFLTVAGGNVSFAATLE
ncbi:insulin-like growth factor-binding protein complex acid labile subunit isoform X2 [Athalia rosae]|uniref:insulin-like growth factor-binding protein complex acid labile subunit isoform X2 n=1 Tax=Athalia rosae TaxID=37344 RepID=UPI0020347226|nr:insulin-like growth factor-binding protein complex acid labile subunit isoform X2 [Athalia rosae]